MLAIKKPLLVSIFIIAFLFLFVNSSFAKTSQDILIQKADEKEFLNITLLKECATNNWQKVNTKIVFIDGETADKIENSYQTYKQLPFDPVMGGYNPAIPCIKDFILPEKITQPSYLEIFDIVTLPFLFGSIATKSITKAPKIAKVASKLTRSDYTNLGATDLLNKAVRLRQLAKEEEVAEGAVKAASQAAGKKGISILQKIKQKLLNFLLFLK